MNQKTKICVLHGAISNAGDFLIYERGKKLLQSFFGDNIDFTYKLRSKPINGNFDGLIILGGPLISRKIHPQVKNIIEYIKDKEIPCTCIGLGISGEKFDSNKDYFLDCESICFWKYVYETSKLFSVRDKITLDVLTNYGIGPELTGCPALFNLESDKDLSKNNSNKISKVVISIPDLTAKSYSSIKPFLTTLNFLYILRKKFCGAELGIIFQHGYSIPQQIIKKLANIRGIQTYNVSGKSLDSFAELYEYDVHIGTRLHSHIFFLSLNKPSFLFNVDMRTEAFLKTIGTPSDTYTISGIGNLIDMLEEGIAENDFDDFHGVPHEIKRFYVVMENFLNNILLFYNTCD